MNIIVTFLPSPAVPCQEDVRHPPAGASAIEVRADLLPVGCDLESVVRAAPLPVVLTIRSRAEGGRGPDEPAVRRDFFVNAVTLPVALVDLEAARDLDLLGSVVPGERAVVSTHLPDVPADLEQRVRGLLGAPARLVKVVAVARSVLDVAAVLRAGRALSRLPEARQRAVLFAAGEVACLSRLLGPMWGTGVAYAAWGTDRVAAPGQLVPEELLALTGHLDGPPRRLFAVIGQKVAASLSPRMHSAAYRALGLPYLFAPLEVATETELHALLRPLGEGLLDELGCEPGGFAVTRPWKQAAASRCTVLAPRAARAMAANTVLPRPGKLLGDCTDVDGVTRALHEAGVKVSGTRAVVLGTGGAARAAAVALDLAGARVALLGRDMTRARAAATAVGVDALVDPGAAHTCSVVVNATPAGGRGEPIPMLEELRLGESVAALDLPYGVERTGLEELASARGWRYISGRDVLLWQGVAQLAAMTSAPPPVEAMAAALGLVGDATSHTPGKT